VVSSGNSNKLHDLLELVKQPVTLELFYKLRQELTTDEIQCAYRAIFFNRTTFSGILYSGPIGGKEQKSKYAVDCRYNVKKLCQKITQCFNLLSGRTTVSNKDFIAYDVLIDTNYPAYLDPPYYVKGNILYIEYMKPQEHNNLSELLCKRKNWVLSYDDCSEIRDLYKGRTIIDSTTRYCINGKKGFIVINDENHTMGNFISDKLQEHKDILFASYNMPHPLENIINIHYSIKNNNNIKNIFIETINHCINLMTKIQTKIQTHI
jgi:DNA-directed RNA polymerase subunit L